MGTLSMFLQRNRAASHRFNRLFSGRICAIREFEPIVLSLLRHNASAVDIGGGRHPLVSPEIKEELDLRVTGVDVSAAELNAAPHGSYDQVLVSDAGRMAEIPDESADIVYSRAVAEHVDAPRDMFYHTHRALRREGISIHYMPNKWALFALANAAMPAGVARKILYATRPGAEEWAGFRAFYRHTYPSAMRRLFSDLGFKDIEVRCYYQADYLDFFAPAHVAYVMWQNVARWCGIEDLCESFVIIGRK